MSYDRQEYMRKYHSEHRERHRELGRLATIKIKKEVLSYYGGGKLACVRCGFSDWKALSIDHINGDGRIHRREEGVPPGGRDFYYWLRRQGYPNGYQTLCMNCQFIKRYEAGEDAGRRLRRERNA